MENPLRRLEERRQVNAAFKRFALTPDGQVILRFIFKQAFGTTSTYVERDPNQTFMNEGARRLMLSIIRKCNIDESQLLQMTEDTYRESA